MKKIVGIMSVALVLASSVFAVDFAARVAMDGKIAGGNIAVEKDEDGNKTGANSAYLLQVDAKDQKDADALILSTNGDKAGANFQFWYNYAGSDADLKVRSVNLWFKPLDFLKVKVGDVSTGTYKEMLHWWKDPVGGSLADWKSWGAKYKSFATVEGAGLEVEANIPGVDGLWVTAGVTPGTGVAFASFDDVVKSTAAYGLGAKYSNIAGLPLSAAITWHDDGNTRQANAWGEGKDEVAYKNTLSPKWLAIGADYGNMWAPGLYAMANARLRFEQKDGDEKTTIRLAGITIDNFFKYSVGAFQALLRTPVTFRTPEKVEGTTWLYDDPSYVCWSAKVQYGMSGFTPYFLFGSDLNNDGAWVFTKDFKDTVNLELKPGLTTSFGSCSVDLGVEVDLAAPIGKKDIAWYVPFSLSVAF